MGRLGETAGRSKLSRRATEITKRLLAKFTLGRAATTAPIITMIVREPAAAT
eukprot:COSAG06_NODE_19522_length_834_cov_1.861224_1_plen_51_part_10